MVGMGVLSVGGESAFQYTWSPRKLDDTTLDLTHAELSELIRRIIEREGRLYEIGFWSDVLHANLPAQVYNRLYNAMNWPTRPMTPEEMLIDAMSQPLPGM